MKNGFVVKMCAWFKNINRTLLEQVKKVYKCSLKHLTVGPEPGPLSDLNNKGRAVYISAPGDLSKNINRKLLEQVKKAYKSSLSAIHESRMIPTSNNDGKAVDKWNKWATLVDILHRLNWQKHHEGFYVF